MTSIAPHIDVDKFTAKDLYSPEVIANPYPYYDLLRDKPIQYGLEDYPPGTTPGADKPIPAWVVLKHEDLLYVTRNHKIFSSRDRMQEASDSASLMLVNHDQPEHTWLRNIAKQAFAPKRVESDVAPWLKEVVDEMLEQEGSGYIDFMTTLAAHLPAKFIAKLLGTPQKDAKKIRDWSDAYMATSHLDMEGRLASNVELNDYYTEKVAERFDQVEKGMAEDNLMTALIKARDEENGRQLSQREVVRFCITMVAGGAESSVYLLGNQVATMLEFPELYQQMREDRSLVRPFLEESIRRDGPLQRVFREATEDTILAGQEVKKGQWVATFFASGNRDPRVFEKPNEFILNRKNIGKNLTFSHGIHHCIASSVARNEAAAMINGILDRYKAVEPGDGPVVRQSEGFINYGPKKCPVNFIPA